MTPFMVMTIFRTSLMYAIVTFTSESLFSYCSMTVFNSKANVLTFLDEPEIFFSYNIYILLFFLLLVGLELLLQNEYSF